MTDAAPRLPDRLQGYLDLFAAITDRSERIQLLIDIADRFRDVPGSVARRPFSRKHLAPHCESEAYVWVLPTALGTVELHFAVENPQGISARAMAVILTEALAGASAEQVARIPSDLPHAFFGRELSMGKSMGLMGMVALVKSEAARLAAHRLP